MAAVRIEEEAFSDERYERLALKAGLADADHARGKMMRLWRQCTIEQRHILPVEDVQRILGPHGVEALIAAGLGSKTRSGVRVHGTQGRIEWLGTLRDNGKHGKKGGEFGKLGGRPRKPPQGGSKNPLKGVNENPPLALALAPAPSEKIPEGESPARDPRTPEPSGTPRDVGLAARSTEIWTDHVRQYDELRAQISPDMPSLNSGSMPIGWRDLRERLRGYEDLDAGEKACRHVLAVRRSEAETKRSLRWFGHTVWREDQFTHAISTPLTARAPPLAARAEFVPHFPFTLPEDA